MIARFNDIHLAKNATGKLVSFEVAADSVREIKSNRVNSTKWEEHPLRLPGYLVFPYGQDNRVPSVIRETVSQNHLAPRVFKKRKFLTWGSGPVLYTDTLDESQNKIIRKYVNDPEVEAWLKSWGYQDYLRRAIEDFNYCEGHFTKIIRSKSSRIGRPRIDRLEHLMVNDCRLACRETNKKNPPPTHVVVGDWESYYESFKSYPVTDPASPVKHPVSIHYSHFYSFSTRYYARPDVLGTLNWIKRSNAIPPILESWTENSMNLKYHIISPQNYWNAKEEQLKDRCAQEGKEYNDDMLEDLKDEIFESLASMLSGAENVGKFWTSEKVLNVIGNSAIEEKWEILPVDQKVKEYIESQIEIAKRADFATIAGLGLHQALANIAADGKSDSGSEQLYALKNYLLTEVNLPEQIITEAVNMALAVNFPDRKVKLGFYRELPAREEDETSKNRISDAV